MKNLFLALLVLPLLSLADDDAVRPNALPGDSPTAAIRSDGALANKTGLTSEPICPSCVQGRDVRLDNQNTNASRSSTGSHPEESATGVKQGQ